ncbi:MAG: peptidase M1 [Candidatus Kapaibacterium sp.]|nr:MAG: peptidase M1 [Candidatus Kapabacteria bacterium]
MLQGIVCSICLASWVLGMVTTSTSAQHTPVCGLPPQVHSAIERRPYDVLRYDLLLDWRTPLADSSQDARPYWGRQTITLRAEADQLSTIELDADRALAIETVRFRRTPSAQWQQATFSRPDSDVLAVTLDPPLSSGDTVALQIDYRNMSQFSRPQDLYGGYNRYWRDPATDTLLPAPLAYTMSQPNNARRWMPCNDRPYDKALATITIAVPPGFTALSNGTPEQTVLDGDTVSALRYQSSEPIASYLMVAIASRFATLERLYASQDSLRHIPLRLYLWQTDSVAYADNARWMLDATAAMMGVFERTLTPYPFSSYGQALLYPYFKGAMEHQTMTTLYRDALVQRWENVVAHELAHQWLGDLVTCATWNDLWLNEGGATYGERLWIEFAYGPDNARRYFAQRRDRDYFRSDGGRSQPPVYNTSGTNIFNTGTTYVKGGWIYHMMRTMLGDSTFFALVREYLRHFAHRSLETEDLRTFCEQFVPQPPVPWRTFFDQWVYAVGHPILHADLLSIEETARGYHVRVRIAQVQDSSAFLPVYVVPLQLRLREYWSGGAYDTTVLLSQREHVVTLEVPFLPRTLELDPDDAILCQKDTAALVLNVQEAQQPAIAVLPNPIERGQDVTVWIGTNDALRVLRLWQSDGRLVAEVHANGGLVHLPTAELAAGVYVLEIEHGVHRYHQTIVVVP